VSNINASGVRQLTTCGPPSCTQDVEPAGLPDGKQVAFMQSDYGAAEIYVVSAAGGKPTPVTPGPGQYMMPQLVTRGRAGDLRTAYGPAESRAEAEVGSH
jgi:Tol biopolymer transport system component